MPHATPRAMPEIASARSAAALDAAGLSWASDCEPGIRRVRRGQAFTYRDAEGRALTDEQVLERIRRLAIPPAYEDVWICPRADGHIQGLHALLAEQLIRQRSRARRCVLRLALRRNAPAGCTDPKCGRSSCQPAWNSGMNKLRH